MIKKVFTVYLICLSLFMLPVISYAMQNGDNVQNGIVHKDAECQTSSFLLRKAKIICGIGATLFASGAVFWILGSILFCNFPCCYDTYSYYPYPQI